MTTPAAQASGYPTWEIKEANLSLQDLPGGNGQYGNLAVAGGLAVSGSYVLGVPGADPTGVQDSTTAIQKARDGQRVGAHAERNVQTDGIQHSHRRAKSPA